MNRKGVWLSAICFVLIAGLSAVFVSGKLFASRYLTLMARSFHPDLQIRELTHEDGFFGSKLSHQMTFLYRETNETLIADIQTKVSYLPWGIRSVSDLELHSDKISLAEIEKEFGSRRLLQLISSITPWGMDYRFITPEFRNEKGHFAPLELELSPTFIEGRGLERLTYQLQWQGMSLSFPQTTQQRLSLGAASLSGELYPAQSGGLWLGENHLQLSALDYLDGPSNIKIENGALNLALSEDEQKLALLSQWQAEQLDLSGAGFAAKLQQLAAELELGSLESDAVVALFESQQDRELALRQLFAKGGALFLRSLHFITDGGAVDGHLLLSLKDVAQQGQSKNDTVLTHLSARGELLFDQLLLKSPTLGAPLFSLKQNGYLSVSDKTQRASMPISFEEMELRLNGKKVAL